MPDELSQAFLNLIVQMPLAGVGLYIAQVFLKREEEKYNKLIATFETEIKSCEQRYSMVFQELMKIKDLLN